MISEKVCEQDSISIENPNVNEDIKKINDSEKLEEEKRKENEFNVDGNIAKNQIFIQDVGSGGFTINYYATKMEPIITKFPVEKKYDLRILEECIEFVENFNSDYFTIAVLLCIFEAIILTDLADLKLILEYYLIPNNFDINASQEVQIKKENCYTPLNSILAVIGANKFVTVDGNLCISLGENSILALINMLEQFPKLQDLYEKFIVEITQNRKYHSYFYESQLASSFLEIWMSKVIDLQNQRNSLANQLNLINEGKCANFAALGYATLEEAKKSVESHIVALDAQITALNNIDLSKVTQGIYGIGNAASSASSKLSKLQSGMENLLSQTISWLKQEYNDAQEAQEDYYESQIDALEDAKNAAKDRWDAEKEAIEDAKDSYNDFIDAQIELLKRQKEADDYAKSRAEKEDAVADIENQLLAIENDDSIEAQKMRLELQEQLKEAKDELEELQSDREYELREQALQDEKDRYNDEVDAKLDAIEKQSEAEEKAYQDRIDRLRKYLDAVRDSEKTEAQWRAEAYDWIENREEELYQNLIEWNRIYGDGRDSTVEQWFKEAEGWRAWGETFAEA